MPKFTEEQQRAIDEEGTNIIVSAGAGSGKTAVLSERVLRKVKTGTPINRLLILTFTKAAAGEMKDRIRKKLYQEGLKEAVELIDNSYITTFDSFALSVVKKYHVELGLPKEIGITEEAVLRLEKERILEELFDELYEEEEESFLRLLSSFALKDDGTLKQYILSLLDAFDQLLKKEEVFETYEETYYSEAHLKQLEERYLQKIKETQEDIRDTVEELLAHTEGKFQEKLLDAVEPLLEAPTYDVIVKKLDFKLPVLPRGSSDEVKACKARLSDLIKEIKSLCHYEDQEEILNELVGTKENTLTLLGILKELDRRFQAFKREEDLYNFMDIARFAIQAVRDFKEIQQQMRSSFDEIMIDEYQDTNDIQEAFISYIASNNVYMVGDMKQSIYRFRNANPLIFKEKYDHYKKKEGGIAIDLAKNFRSRSEVLDDINLLFSELMDDALGGVTYPEGHAMIFGNTAYLKEKMDTNYFLEVYTYQMEEKDPFQKEEKEIFMIAEDIKDKMESGYQVFDKDQGILRPITYSDFAILLDRSKYFDTYKKVFEYLGIPITILKDDKLQGEMDISLLRNLFLLPALIRDRNFKEEFRHAYTSIARSFLYEIPDNEIYKSFMNQTFFESELYQTFSTLKDVFDKTTPCEMLFQILKATKYEEKLLLQGNVSPFRKRMEYFYQLASSLEKSGKSNQDFLDFLSQLIEKGLEMGVSYGGSQGNAISIMSIHKSKGLEYPICYFADFDHKFNFQELKEKVKFSVNYGIILPSLEEEEEKKTIQEQLLKEEVLDAEVSEKIRLFYVALTRAREKMIIVTPRIDKEKEEVKDLTNGLTYQDKIKALSFKKMLDLVYERWISKEKQIDEIPSLTKDYLLPRSLPKLQASLTVEPFAFMEEKEVQEEQDTSHFSKTMLEPLTEEKEANVELGLKMHAIFERLDFENPEYEHLDLDEDLKKSVKAFVESDFMKKHKHDKMYREYEFLEETEHTVYHGIIDLLLLSEKEAIILDYKLKNVHDKAYNEQLLGYKSVIEKRTGLPTKTFLYSILEQKLQEIFDK